MDAFFDISTFSFYNPIKEFFNGFNGYSLNFKDSLFDYNWNYTKSNTRFDGSNGDTKQLYNFLGLQKEGLSYEVFAFAMKGYNNLNDKGNGQLGIVDPKSKKYYLIDVKNYKFKGKTDVKFGSGNMNSVANANRHGSNATLSGFQKVNEEYTSSKSWRQGTKIDGLENGINNNARAKGTVIHYNGGNFTQGCIGFTPVYKNGAVDKTASWKKMRTLFPKGTILFTYPTNVNEYKRLSTLV